MVAKPPGRVVRGKHSDASPEALPPYLSPHAEGTLLSVYVQPGARKSGVVGVHGEALKVAIAAPPVDGKANSTLLATLRGVFSLPADRLTLERGEKSRHKLCLLRGLSPMQAWEILRSVIPPLQ